MAGVDMMLDSFLPLSLAGTPARKLASPTLARPLETEHVVLQTDALSLGLLEADVAMAKAAAAALVLLLKNIFQIIASNFFSLN